MADESAARSRSPLLRIASLLAFAISVTFAMQCLRVLFPVVYSFREQSGVIATALVLVAVLVAPVVLAVLVRGLGPHTTFAVAVGALGAMRLVVQLVTAVTLPVIAVATAVGLVAVGAGIVLLWHRGGELVAAFVLGLTLDTVLRAAGATWDLAWRSGAPAALVTATLVVVLVVAAIVGRTDAVAPHGAAALTAVIVGPYLVLQLLFLQSPAFAASSGGVSLATAVVVVLAGDVLALAAVALTPGWRVPRGAVIGAALVLALAAWVLTGATGVGVLAVLLGAQFLGTALVVLVCTGNVTATSGGTLRDALGVTAGSLLLGASVFLYQIHYDNALPFSNRWVPLAAGAMLGLAALAGSAPARSGREGIVRTGRLALAVVVIAAVLFVGLATGEPDLAPTVTHPSALRVVTYNPHETITRDGQLDPEAMVEEVRRLQPDVLVVEEAGRGWALSGMLDLAEWSKRQLGMPYIWAPSADKQFGNLLFSRVPILGARIVALPHRAGSMKRSAIVAHVGPVAGEVVTVIGTHLQNGEGRGPERTRIAEMHALVRAWHGQDHTVLAGDLNSDPGSPELQVLLDAGFDTTQPTRRCTLKTSNDNCVDWILVTHDLQQSQVRADPFDAFDHRPVVATVRPS